MNVKITEAPLLDTSFSLKSIPKLDLNGPSLGQTAQLNGVYSPLLENSKEPLKTKNRPKIYESLGKVWIGAIHKLNYVCKWLKNFFDRPLLISIFN